jgi:hypothetical protein
VTQWLSKKEKRKNQEKSAGGGEIAFSGQPNLEGVAIHFKHRSGPDKIDRLAVGRIKKRVSTPTA